MGTGPAPENQFLGTGYGTNLPWKAFFRGGPPREPPLKMIFPGAADAITRPWKSFYRGGSKHEPPLKFNSRQAKIWNSIQISISCQFIVIHFPLYLIILFFISRPFSPVKQLHHSIQIFKILFPFYLNLCFPPILF